MTVHFEEFQKVELKIGKILEAERVTKSEKLLKLQVDLGEISDDGSVATRQIVAGIGKAYEPEALIGKEFLFIANLEPRTLMGLESQGMVLAGTDEEGLPVLLSPGKELPAGTLLH